MNPARAGSYSLAIFAIVFLLGFSLVVYAVPGTFAPSPLASASTSSSGSATPQGNTVYYKLLHVAAAASSPGWNATGSAGISVSGQTLSIVWGISQGTPGEQLELVMSAVAATSTGASKTQTFDAVTTTSIGNAGGTVTTTLAPGSYSIGLTLVDPSTSARATVFTSDPASAEVAVPSSQTVQTSTATGNALSYSLVPLPVYLGQQAPANYSFKEGGALIVVLGDQLQITTSFLGSPGTQFYTVVQTAHQNVTAGATTTTTTGGGVYKGNVTLSPGSYQVGLLMFAAGDSVNPVAVSVPRAIQVTLPYYTTSTTSSTSHSSSSSSTSSSKSSTYSSSSSATSTSSTTQTSESHSSTSTSYSSTSQTHTSSATSSSSSLASAVNEIAFNPVRTSAIGQSYQYGEGSGGYSPVNGYLYFSLAFNGQAPEAHFSLVMTVNGTVKTIGNYTTTTAGAGSVAANTYLGTGLFAISLSVVDLSNFNTPMTVLISDPATFLVNSRAATNSTATSTSASATSTTATSTSTQVFVGPLWTFKVQDAYIPNVPKGYLFASSGTVMVTLDTDYSLLNVVIGFQHANPSTTYNAALTLNGTSYNLGSMTTSKTGSAELHSSIQVNPGLYLMGVAISDVSDIAAFNASGPVLVMLSDPSTQLVYIAPPAGQVSSSTSTSSPESSSASTSTTTVTVPATTISAGTKVESQIQDALNLTIPASVQITPLASTASVYDDRFSLSVGQLVGNGLVIAISGENVTGPRVLLVNMSKTAPLALYPALNVTLDGVPVMEASSAVQVLNPTSSDPPRYVLVATADSIQLLVSIPHFSLHLIQVAGEIVQRVQTYLTLDAPLLAGSVIVITLAFGAAYAARRRYFVVL